MTLTIIKDDKVFRTHTEPWDNITLLQSMAQASQGDWYTIQDARAIIVEQGPVKKKDTSIDN